MDYSAPSLPVTADNEENEADYWAYFDPDISVKDIPDFQSELEPPAASYADSAGSSTRPSSNHHHYDEPIASVKVDDLQLPTFNYRIPIQDVYQKLTHLGDDLRNKKITQVEIHRNPLIGFQLTDALFHHAFVTLQTDDGKWWSIERNMEGITFQGSREKLCVLNYYRKKKRTTAPLIPQVEILKSAKSEKTMDQLVNFMHEKGIFKKKYDLVSNNCQKLARSLFNYLKSEGGDVEDFINSDLNELQYSNLC